LKGNDIRRKRVPLGGETKVTASKRSQKILKGVRKQRGNTTKRATPEMLLCPSDYRESAGLQRKRSNFHRNEAPLKVRENGLSETQKGGENMVWESGKGKLQEVD